MCYILSKMSFLFRCFNVGHHLDISTPETHHVTRNNGDESSYEYGATTSYQSLNTHDEESTQELSQPGDLEWTFDSSDTRLLGADCTDQDLRSVDTDSTVPGTCRRFTLAPDRKYSHRSHCGYRQDGFASAAAIFTILVATNTTLILSQWLTVDQTYPINPLYVYIVFSTEYLIGTLIMLNILCRPSKFLRALPDQPTTDGSARKWRRTICDNITLICIFVFLIMGLFRDIFPIFGTIECMDVYRVCKTSGAHVVMITNRLMRNLFMFVQFAFCVLVHRRNFKQICTVSYSLLLIAAITLTMWFQILMYESRKIFKNGHHQWFLCSIEGPNTNTSELSDTLMTQCTTGTLYAFQLQKQSYSFIYTAHIEFSLLVTEIVLYCLFSRGDKHTLGYGHTVSNGNRRYQPQSQLSTTRSVTSNHVDEERLPLNTTVEEQTYYGSDCQTDGNLRTSLTSDTESRTTTQTGFTNRTADSGIFSEEEFCINGEHVRIEDVHVKLYLASILRKNPERVDANGLNSSTRPNMDRMESVVDVNYDKHKKTVAVVFTILAVLLGICSLLLGIFAGHQGQPETTTITPTAISTTRTTHMVVNYTTMSPIVTTDVQKQDQYSTYFMYEMTQLVQFSSMILASMVAFWTCDRFPSCYKAGQEQSYCGLVLVLILTMFCVFLDLSFCHLRRKCIYFRNQ